MSMGSCFFPSDVLFYEKRVVSPQPCNITDFLHTHLLRRKVNICGIIHYQIFLSERPLLRYAGVLFTKTLKIVSSFNSSGYIGKCMSICNHSCTSYTYCAAHLQKKCIGEMVLNMLCHHTSKWLIVIYTPS